MRAKALALEVIAQVRHTHPEVAVKYGVRSTPAIAINGALAWQGVPLAQALRERLEVSLRRGEET